MPIRPHARTLAAALLSLSLGAAWAAPDLPKELPNDAVSRFLVDKGLVDASAPAAAVPEPEGRLARQMRQVRDGASDMVLTAMNFLGVPYRRGGNSADEGFDCSGFTRHIFEMSLGLVLPRRVDEQAGARGLVSVAKEELKPGDLVFFNTLKRTFSHVGIYVGDGKFIHSPRTGSQVRVEDMRYAYWQKRFTGARRASASDTGSAETAVTLPARYTLPAAVAPLNATTSAPVDGFPTAH